MPIYRQIARRLEDAIRSATLLPGALLEDDVHLSRRLGLSRATVRRAIHLLVDQGLVRRQRGVGTVVAHCTVARSIEVASLYDDLERSGRAPATMILSTEICKADATIAVALGVDAGSRILRIRRLRTADRIPIAILDNALPARFVDLDLGALARRGLYDLLRGRGVEVHETRQRIGARTATSTETEYLGVPHGSAVLALERAAFDHVGEPIEFGRVCYRPDIMSFEMTLAEW
ncbi:myo-inositol degradation transcriptional regulator [Agromyces tropicus]|uniref:Myo-inositol degradation transcriptional regulator n=2 Tax=Agromyces tropicus TaxID=555371 RepID=A0ABP5GD55_9MICO